jgi:hypothetical protein
VQWTPTGRRRRGSGAGAGAARARGRRGRGADAGRGRGSGAGAGRKAGARPDLKKIHQVWLGIRFSRAGGPDRVRPRLKSAPQDRDSATGAQSGRRRQPKPPESSPGLALDRRFVRRHPPAEPGGPDQEFPNAHQDDIRQESGTSVGLVKLPSPPESVLRLHFGVSEADSGPDSGPSGGAQSARRPSGLSSCSFGENPERFER